MLGRSCEDEIAPNVLMFAVLQGKGGAVRLYLNLLERVLQKGSDRPDRTGTGVRGIFGYQMRFDLAAGFPLVTTKKLHLTSIIHELLWFLRGETNVRPLQKAGVSIWDEWADEKGELGPVYGKQWRSWARADGSAVDQIRQVVEEIKKTPHSRRLLVSAWNVGELEDMALPPCHCLFQFYADKGRLSCQVYQRSADIFLGLPFNIASYALLTHMVARATNLEAGIFIHTLGDAHLYHTHFKQAREQLTRNPYPLPRLRLEPKDIFGFSFEDICIEGYQSHPPIKAEVAV